MGDLEERALWDDYQAAFDEALTKTSTPWAPWYVIPANRNWFRNLAVSTILADTIAGLKPAYPPEPDLPVISSPDPALLRPGVNVLAVAVYFTDKRTGPSGALLDCALEARRK